MNFFTACGRKFDALLDWLCSHRRYRLIAVSALTGGWVYLDSARNQICWVQSQLVDAGTPLEISASDAQTMLNTESGLGWEKVTPDDRTWYSDLNQLVAVAKSELAKRGADINEVA
jgi:hypothetical protein